MHRFTLIPQFRRFMVRVAQMKTMSTSTDDVNITQSYFHGASDIPMLGKTLGTALQESVERFADRTAFVYGTDGSRQTYRQLLDEVDRLAAGFLATGITKGDRVGMWGPNIKEWILTQYACARIGAILVNVNPAYRIEETAYALKKVEMKAIVAPRTFKTQDFYDILRQICPELEKAKPGELRSERLPDLRSIIIASNEIQEGAFKFDDVMDMGKDKRHNIENIGKELQFDEPINIQFTSGTTGFPKGTTLTHHNILNNGYFIGKLIGYDGKPKSICMPLPLYHCAGTVVGSISSVLHGVTCVLPSPSFEPEAVLKSIEREKCSYFGGTPTVLIDSMNNPTFEKYDTSSISHCLAGGAPCPSEVMKLAQAKWNAKTIILYGLTECSPVSNAIVVEDQSEIDGSIVGKSVQHVEVKVIDVQTNKVVPVNEQGEVCIRGYSVMKGYWNDPERTKETIDENGWLHSGDLGVMNEKGYLSIVGRLKDLVIRGGSNIFPAEIESFLHRHPKIEDVQIVGVPDERMGEELCACIKLRPGEECTAEEIKEFCKGQIAHFKIPRYVEFVDTYPMTVSLKVQKFALQEMMAKKLGLYQ